MSTLYVNTIVPNSGSTVNISGSLFVSGTINLGDADTDSVSFGAEVSSSIIPDANDTYDLGSSAKSWKTIHGTSSLANTASHAAFAVTAVTSSHVAANGAASSQNNITSLGTLTGLTVNGNTVIGSASATHKITGSVDINGSVSASGNISASNFNVTNISAGTITGSGTIKGNKLISVTNVEAVSFTGSLSGSATTASYAISASYASSSTLALSATSASYISGGGVLSGITGLTAGGDLDIGTHAFRAQTLLADGLTSGRVVFAGTNGLLSDDADLTFSSDTLSATKISSSGNIIAASFTGSLTGSATNALLATTASYALAAATTVTDLTPTLETKTAGFTAAVGREYIVNDADGAAIVLPNAVEGARITILIGTLITSNTTTITAQSGDLLKGYAFLEATDAANNKTMFVPDGSDDLIITLNGSTKGGLVGDRIELVGISGTEWRVRATLSHTGTAATPFS